MTKRRYVVSVFTVTTFLGSYLALAQQPAQQNAAQTHPMTFFVTSVGMGKGADLGGPAGADAHCQTLATAGGVGNHTWHAYLSLSMSLSAPFAFSKWSEAPMTNTPNNTSPRKA